MRQLILDTETTGLDPKLGHRIIEIGAIELVDRRPTGRNLHVYCDPEREIDAGATQVHGKTWDDLRDKPKFADIVEEFVAFAQGAQWIIHNAPFDVGFLDAEFTRMKRSGCATVYASLIDTLAQAREAFPGKRNNLDALCERMGVSNAHRTVHGALLDAQLLAEVYLAMTRGQDSLTIDMGTSTVRRDGILGARLPQAGRVPLPVLAPTEAELAAHGAYLEVLERDTRGRCVWLHQPAPA